MRILLCLVDAKGNVFIHLDRLSHIAGAIQSRSYVKFFHKDTIGETCLLAVNESKRLLAIYASARVRPFLY